jgi:hypothetical protein
MKRLSLVAIIVASLVVGLAIGVQASSGKRSAVIGSPLTLEQLPRASQVLAPIRCTTVRCLNTQLTKLNAFVRRFYKCTLIYRVSRYPGYEYNSGGQTITTTAIDYRNAVGDPFRYMLVWRTTCTR